jgi:type I restriction enzyme R subunit
MQQEVKPRDGKVIVHGQVGICKTVKSADIVLYHKPNMPLAIIEETANQYEVGKGIPQGLDYARLLDVAFIIASNGDGLIFHKKTAPAEAS